LSCIITAILTFKKQKTDKAKKEGKKEKKEKKEKMGPLAHV